MKMLNLFEKSVVSIAALFVVFCANAAQNGRVSMMQSATSARMPTLPTVGLTTIGNPAVTTLNEPAESKLPHITPTPNPGPGPRPNPDPNPDPKPDPKPNPEPCPDGGVRNSDYTVTMCMNDVLQCVNNGGLEGGLNSLFCGDIRNSIFNGMRLCQAQIDRCIREARVECRNVYTRSSDVWLDFDSRIIQPEYYNFVLRKTGLTPNQAENTCLLLDRNTYGSSFAAVSDRNAVNAEYAKPVGAYNNAQHGSLSKNNPQGVTVNTTGYDGNRGHYARWDGCSAECLIRVAAYNKDDLIKNSWLFGAVGNDMPAEVWEKTGSTFTCNKDLFDFSSLMNKTKTTAVVAVGGGTVLGTAIGAGVGAANYNKKHEAYLESVDKKNDPCTDEQYRKDLGAKIYASNNGAVLKSYAYKNVTFSGDEKNKTFTGSPIFGSGYNFNDLDEQHCRDLHELNEKVYLYDSMVSQCLANGKNREISTALTTVIGGAGSNRVFSNSVTFSSNGNTLTLGESVTCGAPVGVTQNDAATFSSQCMFVPLQIQTYTSKNSGPLCSHGNECLTVDQISYQINELKGLLASVMPATAKVGKDADKGKEIAKGALIGGATGAGVGGIVTGITALVEKNNITCRVGDGLNSVALGKSHTIDSLKDFYVKWNLQLPDTITPTSAVSDRASWEQACSQFNGRLSDCPHVQINLRNGSNYTLIQNACVASGSICIVNESVARSHGIQ